MLCWFTPPILWPPDGKSWLIGGDPDTGKNIKQKKKGAAEIELVGWCHWLKGHEFEWTPGDSEGQGSLAYCSPIMGLQTVEQDLATEQLPPI